MVEEFYPMPSFVTLSVTDVHRSTAWYQSVLGFRVVFSMPGPGGIPAMAHLRLSKYADLLLTTSRNPVASPRGAGVQVNFTLAGRAVDELAAHVRSQWSHCEGPVTQPWNAREFYVADPDGYRLAFIQQAQSGLSIEQVVDQVAHASGPPGD